MGKSTGETRAGTEKETLHVIRASRSHAHDTPRKRKVAGEGSNIVVADC